MHLFSASTIENTRVKTGNSPWMQAGWQAVQQRTAQWQSQSGQIPTEAGGWIHNYVCPEHWHPLLYDGNTPGLHRCLEGHTCEGEKYDAAWRVWRHRQIADLAREAALAYVILEDEGGRETAVSILSQYANFYTQFDGQSDAESWMLSGHAFNQALTEALWAVPLIHTYDLVADSLTSTQKAKFSDDLWQPLINVMTRAQDKLIAQDKIKSNYMAWLNVTLGCLGFTLQEQQLVERALAEPAGFSSHLNQSVWADGLEYEATPYYHNFVLLAHLMLAEAAKANDIDLYSVVNVYGQSLVNMGCAFAHLAWPDGAMPDLSDGSYWQNSIFDPEICQAYEILYAHQPEDSFAWTLQNGYNRQEAKRDNWAALLYGRDDIERPSPPPAHTFLKASGIAVLRSNKNLAAMIPFGPYRKDHHHADRLSLTVWPFAKDAGNPLYSIPARKAWYQHSYAHNTLVVDGKTHANCGGELLDWNGRTLHLSAPNAYPDVVFNRTIEMVDDTIFDELYVQSTMEHSFDWVFHIDGYIEIPRNAQTCSGSLTPDGPGAYIALIAQLPIDSSITFDIFFELNNFRLTLQGERPFTLLLGKAPGTSRHPQRQRTVLIGRTIGTHQRYQTTISTVQ